MIRYRDCARFTLWAIGACAAGSVRYRESCQFCVCDRVGARSGVCAIYFVCYRDVGYRVGALSGIVSIFRVLSGWCTIAPCANGTRSAGPPCVGMSFTVGRPPGGKGSGVLKGVSLHCLANGLGCDPRIRAGVSRLDTFYWTPLDWTPHDSTPHDSTRCDPGRQSGQARSSGYLRT